MAVEGCNELLVLLLSGCAVGLLLLGLLLLLLLLVGVVGCGG